MFIFTINDQLEGNDIIIIIFDHRTQTRKPMEWVFRDEPRRLQDHHRQRRRLALCAKQYRYTI